MPVRYQILPLPSSPNSPEPFRTFPPRRSRDPRREQPLRARGLALGDSADPEGYLKATLDAYAEDPDTDMFEALLSGLDLAIPKLPRKPLSQ